MKKILFILIVIIFSMNICIVNAETESNNSTLEKLLTGSDEERAVIYYTMASTYSELKDHKSAVEYYTKAIELNPKMIDTYIGRAKDCGDMADWQCSLDNYESIKKLRPNDPNAYWATSLYKTNTKDLDGAMADIDKAISMVKKTNATFYAQKARVYLEKKDYNNAVKWAKKALRRDYRDEYTLGLISVMTYENGRFEDVLKVTNDCLKHGKVAKENHVLLLLRAKAFYYTGQKEKAIKQMEDVIKLVPENEEYILLKDKMQKGEKID